jgi:hypothetical protein
MKVRIEIDLNKNRYKWISKMAKCLGMDGVSEFLARELKHHIEESELWIERTSLTFFT